MENNNDKNTPVLENKKRSTKEKIFSFVKWFFIILFLLYIGILVARGIWLEKQEVTEEKIQEIHAQKINIDDAIGKNLPPDPGEFGNKTLKGVDVNENGIRDDVEIAIFKKYPNSAKLRAALLQYAFVTQMILSEKIMNTKIATEIGREFSRADTCVADTFSPRDPESFRDYSEIEKIDEEENFVLDLVFNTKERKQRMSNFYENIRSYNQLDGVCDIDYSKLEN